MQEGVLKRYHIFCGGAYYPVGGWADFLGSVDSLEEVFSFVKQHKPNADNRAWIDVRDSLDRNPQGHWRWEESGYFWEESGYQADDEKPEILIYQTARYDKDS